MISLTEYMNEGKSLHDKLFLQSNLRNISSYFGDDIEDIPDDIKKLIIEHKFSLKEYLIETLKSHDVDSLMKCLDKEYGNEVQQICTVNRSGKHGLVGIKFKNKQLEHINSTKFLNILQFFNYFKTDTWNGYSILEPEYPENCNEETIKLFNNKFVHVTTKKNYEKIRNTGLRVRGHDGKDGYRSYSCRIQLKGKESKENILDFAKEFKEQRLNSIDENYKDWNDTVVLLIDLYTLNIDIWRDHMYNKNEHCYFIKNNIPYKYIKLLYEI